MQYQLYLMKTILFGYDSNFKLDDTLDLII